MKTQKTKLVARIAMALLAGMMVLALASCGSKNPLAGNAYHLESWNLTFTFTEKECEIKSKGKTFIHEYKLDTKKLTGTCYANGEPNYEGGEHDTPFEYREDGSAIIVEGYTLNKVK